MKSSVSCMPRRMPARKFHRLGCLVATTAIALAGCSRSADVSTGNQPSQPEPIAVARGRIDIEGGLLALSMPREGTLAKVAVHEGDHVRLGQLLAQLDTEPARLAVEESQAELEQAQGQSRLLTIKLAAAKQRSQRLQAAAAAGAGDGQSADDAREAAAQIEAEKLVARAGISMAEQKLAQARVELNQRSLLAPFDADVVSMSAQPGATVSATSGALFTLLPNKPRIVRAELNESFVGKIQPGMRAEVVDDGDGKQWSARVVRIGHVYGPTSLENDPQIRVNARTVECVLAFDQPQDLRIGLRVIVRFATADTPATSTSKG